MLVIANRTKSLLLSHKQVSSQIPSPQIWDSSPNQVLSHVTQVHNSAK